MTLSDLKDSTDLQIPVCISLYVIDIYRYTLLMGPRNWTV